MMTTLIVTSSVTGCATVNGNFCDLVQPFWFESDAEVDATPMRPKRYIRDLNTKYARLCM